MERRGLRTEVLAERHGTRACYVLGCRCQPCRQSNVRRYHARQAQAKALAAEIAAPPRPSPQAWTRPDGSTAIRVYKHGCPGVRGQPCPTRSHLRKDSKGGCCRGCRERLVWDGLVPAAAARAHLRQLSRLGVGRHSVAAACDVSATVIHAITKGIKPRIRASTERRILGVTKDARAGAALVPAGATWRLIRQLLEEGYTKTFLAAQLGSRAPRPALQLRRGRVLASTAAAVERLHRRLTQ